MSLCPGPEPWLREFVSGGGGERQAMNQIAPNLFPKEQNSFATESGKVKPKGALRNSRGVMKGNWEEI